ncbi:MAG: transposase [Algicola sp.]|nr:transposase [Algicola sp.]
MPRPPRIEYEHAFYHVMNRGRDRCTIFHDETYFQAFLDTLGEACQRFDCVIHAYCLLSNHYHLLIETPKANLSRVMRHVNGVYTQRYNRLSRADGPLFRGRFKSILVDQDSYLLQLSRYIHRNPVEMKKPLVSELADYRWSSYPTYIGLVEPVSWLERDKTYAMLGHTVQFEGYANYVRAGVDEQTAAFYHKGNMASLIGDKAFRQWVYEELLPELAAEDKSKVIQPDLTIDQVIASVADDYKVSVEEITRLIKGPQKENEARKLAMYLCQQLAMAKLADIATAFQLGHVGSVSFITHQIRKRAKEDARLRQQIERLIKSIVKQAT